MALLSARVHRDGRIMQDGKPLIANTLHYQTIKGYQLANTKTPSSQWLAVIVEAKAI